MKHDSNGPRGAGELIQRIKLIPDFRGRIEYSAHCFMGVPYCESPLNGGPGLPEKLIDHLDCFDCVTFIETVLALASAGDEHAYRMFLLRIRYDGRKPSWEHRLHYTSEWLKSQERRGLLRIIHPEYQEPTVRMLTVIPDIAPVKARISFHEWEVPRNFTSGIIAFGSMRNDLDVFHLGFYFNGMLIHASRAMGSVCSEPLSDFLNRERGAGLLLAKIRMEKP